MRIHKILLLLSITLLSAGCTLFNKPVASGVVKTVNGGADWQFANKVIATKTASLVGLNVSKMFFDPGNREIVYVGGYNDGLFKSEDSGATWKRILSNILVFDGGVSPTDSKTIYAAGVYADHGRLLVTHDGGLSWQQIYNEGSVANEVRTMALNPSNPSQIVLGTTSGTLIKSSDFGLNWQLAQDFKKRINRILWQKGNIYVLLRDSGVYKSGDGGGTFQPLNSTLTSNNGIFDSNNSSLPTVQIFNQFFVDSQDSNLIYVTTDKGLYKTTDEGQAWKFIPLPVKTGGQVARGITIAPNSSNIVFTSVGSTIYKSVDGGNSWQTQKITTEGFVNYILIDPQLPQIVYAGIYGN